MQTRTIEFTLSTLKSINKYLTKQSLQSLVDAGLTEDEQEQLFDGYKTIREEVEQAEVNQEDMNNG